MKPFADMTLEELLSPQGHDCPCGRRHHAGLRLTSVGPNAMDDLPRFLGELGVRKPFILSDVNTRAAAWPLLGPALERAGVEFAEYSFAEAHLEPDEHACGSALMAFDRSCDGLLVVGSGVLNDVGKVLNHAAGLPFVVVATAPSMDGYASDSSSMIRGRIKVSLYNACPHAVVADTRILSAAPMRMLQAGLGDMLAKYLSICEWRIAHLVTGEYYCPEIAALVRASLKKIVDSAEGLRARDPDAVAKVVEGLLLSGVAMAFAGISRPASGLEHYFSHMWEMMSLDRGLPTELHGIQVGIGTLLTLKLWEKLKALQPSREKAEAFIRGFDEGEWEAMVRRVFGGAAEGILAAARAQGRNDPAAHARRLDRTLEGWPEILRIAAEELPTHRDTEALMLRMGMPTQPGDIGFSRQDTVDALVGARDIRDKYLTSSLLWDLGLLYEPGTHAAL
ncbi:MAG TPA: sn-glycerol-1-phosphate dehydrogenase [Candidatus Limnocylindria bacterium]|nr:sn-glycerol-1-phosphate dehydrogenase [Candidatus Limnocylindria bacterium]